MGIRWPAFSPSIDLLIHEIDDADHDLVKLEVLGRVDGGSHGLLDDVEIFLRNDAADSGGDGTHPRLA